MENGVTSLNTGRGDSFHPFPSLAPRTQPYLWLPWGEMFYGGFHPLKKQPDRKHFLFMFGSFSRRPLSQMTRQQRGVSSDPHTLVQDIPPNSRWTATDHHRCEKGFSYGLGRVRVKGICGCGEGEKSQTTEETRVNEHPWRDKWGYCIQHTRTKGYTRSFLGIKNMRTDMWKSTKGLEHNIRKYPRHRTIKKNHWRKVSEILVKKSRWTSIWKNEGNRETLGEKVKQTIIQAVSWLGVMGICRRTEFTKSTMDKQKI